MDRVLILHDLPEGDAAALLPPGSGRFTLFAASPSVRGCAGCFGCWIRTPAVCVIDDRCRGFAGCLPGHDGLLVISRAVFGGLSPDVKAVMDRSIGYLLPFFRYVGGEMHHARRYGGPLWMRYVFYGGDIGERERACARRLAAANAVNFGAECRPVAFIRSCAEIKFADLTQDFFRHARR
ncbi:MAG: flavodoxin family protein [Clostridiales Family XIII bacterium]|jgi:hypothetical protein|nr:flavodoxin family protein [Clostridiales Family XIII bacterium]